VEHDGAAADGRVDPEAQVGRALRQLRLARSWSQEEVAVRMTAYGYDLHQTTIAKIEGAQRPLRVRELADFAALYGVEIQDLVHPPTRSLPEIEQEIAEVTARLDRARKNRSAAAQDLAASREAIQIAQAANEAAAAETTVLEGRLASLSADRQKVMGWESAIPQDLDGVERNTPAPMASPTTSVAGPTVLRIILGANLRRLREARGISAESAGFEIRASRSKIMRLEHGRIGIKQRDVADLLTLYGADEKERKELLDLTLQANTPGWWHDYSDVLPYWFETYIGLEMAAAHMRVYEVQSVPELLQTEDYNRALAVTPRDQGNVESEEIERRIRLRMARQGKFFDRSSPTNLRVVLDEAVLRRQVGGPEVMRDQLKHLAEIAERPNITLQVLPLQAGFAGQGSSFTILLFAESDLHDIVYSEQLTGALYLDQPGDVSTYERLMQQLTTKALTPQKTTRFLQELLQ
jgi:transcriptional regulator with XRE-family HTH domain